MALFHSSFLVSEFQDQSVIQLAIRWDCLIIWSI